MTEIPTQIETGKDRSGDTVPGATDGARQYCQRLGGKEVGSQNRYETCILHTYLNGDRAFLGNIESCKTTGEPAEEIAQRVVAEHNGKGPDEQDEATSHEIIVNRRDHSADNDSEAYHTRTGHQALKGGEETAFAERIVQEADQKQRG